MEAITECERLRRGMVLWYRAVRWLQNVARPSLGEDRTCFLDGLAMQSEAALNNADSRTAYSTARALGAKTAPNTTLKKRERHINVQHGGGCPVE